jgi:uncharacterized Zn finger protein
MQDLRPKVNLRDCETVKCEKCGSIYFREDTNVPFSVAKCDDCGHVNKGFNPFEEEKKSDTILLDSDQNISDAVDSFIND